jgi:hypothetical protein
VTTVKQGRTEIKKKQESLKFFLETQIQAGPSDTNNNNNTSNNNNNNNKLIVKVIGKPNHGNWKAYCTQNLGLHFA